MKKTPGRPKKVSKKPVKPIINKPLPDVRPDDDLGTAHTENITPIEPQFKRLLSLSGFIEAFWEFLSYYARHEDAYEAVERQYEGQFGRRRYSSFESFRGSRDAYLKNCK